MSKREGYSIAPTVTLLLSHSIGTGGLGGASLGSRLALAYSTRREQLKWKPRKALRACMKEGPPPAPAVPSRSGDTGPAQVDTRGRHGKRDRDTVAQGGGAHPEAAAGVKPSMLPVPSPPASSATHSLSL